MQYACGIRIGGLKNRLQEATDRFIPVSGTGKLVHAKWGRPLHKSVRDEIGYKNKLWRKYLQSKDDQVYKQYKKQRNRVRAITRQEEMDEQKDIAYKSKSNPKAFWSYVNQRTKNKQFIPDLVSVDKDGTQTHVTDESEKAELLSNYFSKVFNYETVKPGGVLPTISSEQCMINVSFDVETVQRKLSLLNVNKSPGPDNIHPRVLKEAASVLAFPLCQIFRCSLETGQLPLDWRSGNISAIYKKGKKCLPCNYRPISLTSILCKILESLIRTHLIKFFMDNDLFSNKQFGFLSKRSTVSQLLQILDTWTEQLEKGGQIDIIYTDLEKAFDKVPHYLLLKKLKNFSIDENIMRWITSFLTDRRQRVGVHGSFSQWKPVVSGIPQGSILGPFLFLVYINDIVNTCNTESNMYLYADDTKLSRYIGESQDSLILQKDLDNLNNWIKTWLLKLNIDKCKIMSIGRRVVENKYTIDGIQLERVSNIPDLGVTFDTGLKFHVHVSTIVGRAYGVLGLINRHFRHMTTETFVLLYKSMVRSKLEYAHSVWNPYMKGDIEKLERVQMRATKMIRGLKHLSYIDRLKALNLPTLRYRRQRGDMIEVYKIINGYYDNFRPFSPVEPSRYSTRGNSKRLLFKRCRYDLRKYNFTNRVVGIWNSLPETVVKSRTVNAFKAGLDRHWRDQEQFYDWTMEVHGTGSRSIV
jgi:hypothetical protein